MSDLPFGLSADPFALPATLTAEQTARLIENRVRACGGDPVALFPAETCAEIHRHAHGVTGAVCDLAGKAMRLAAAAGVSSVSPEHVRAAAEPTAERGDQADVVETTPAPAHMAAAAPEAAVAASNVVGPPDPAPDEAVPDDAALDDAVAEDAVPVGAVAEDAAAEDAAPDDALPDDTLPDDIPDLPAMPPGAFALPSEPSKDLAPNAQAWVSRFISTEGAGAPIKPAARIVHPPAVDAADPHALPRIPVERRRAAVSPLPADSPHPERRAVVNFPRGAARDRSRERRVKALAWATAAAATLAMVSLGTVVVHRLRIVSAPPPGSQATRMVAARGPEAAPATPKPGSRSAVPASPRSGMPAPTGPAARPTVASPPPPAAAPVPEPQASAPPEPRGARLGIEVAAYIFPDRAETERQRLIAAGHRVRVVTEWENGAPTYRVVVGSYSSRAAAERAADTLLGTGLVQQARVVTAAGDD